MLICQRGSTVKNSHIEDNLILIFKNSRNPKPEGLIATASVKLKSLRSSISNRFSMSERSLPSDTKKEAVANPVNQHGAQMTQIEMTSAAAGTV